MKFSKLIYGLTYAGIIGASLYRIGKKLHPGNVETADDKCRQHKSEKRARQCRAAIEGGFPVITAEQKVRGGSEIAFIDTKIMKTRPGKVKSQSVVIMSTEVGKNIFSDMYKEAVKRGW